MDLLDVPAGMLAQYGAVSGGGRRRRWPKARAPRRGADYALAMSGVAGPDGGTRRQAGRASCTSPAPVRPHAVVRGLYPGDRDIVRAFSDYRGAASAAPRAGARDAGRRRQAMRRLFVAGDLPAETRRAVETWQRRAWGP